MKEIRLISRSLRGDRRALEELVRLYYGKIYNYIYYRVMDCHLAEDLTQDVFVKLTKALPSYIPAASFSAFLYRIAHNTVVDYYRTAEPARQIPETAPAADLLPRVEAEAEVAMLLERLPPEQRECIVLYYLQGLSFREIAGILEIPIPTVKSRVQRGLAACKKWMEGEK